MRVFGVTTWIIFFVLFFSLAVIVLVLDALLAGMGTGRHSPSQRQRLSFMERATDNLGVVYRMLMQTGTLAQRCRSVSSYIT